MIKLYKFMKKAASCAVCACLMLGYLPQAALADYVQPGDILESWVCQVVVQNGDSTENANLWMNDGVFDQFQLQTEQHVTLDPADGKFANTGDVLNFAAIYFSYYGDYDGEGVLDVKLTNVTLHSTGYDPITLADYSSVDAGTSNHTADNDHAVRYDFQDQLPEDTRVSILQNLESIEFDCYIGSVTFSDAADVEPTVAEKEGYTQLTEAGYDGQLDVFFYAMDDSWTWIQPGSGGKLAYQSDEHLSLTYEGVTDFDEVSVINTCGLKVGYFTEAAELEDAEFDIQFTISNLTMNFEGYDPVVAEGLTVSNLQFDEGSSSSGAITLDSYFPEGADKAAMLKALTSIEIDYNVSYLAATGLEAETEPETTEEATEETTKETEPETTEEETEPEQTTQALTTAAESDSEADTTVAATDDSDSGSTVKIVITVVAVVLLLGALIFVAVMYVKKSKQI